MTETDIMRRIEAAVAAERERCAKVAEKYKHSEARRIAAAIRLGLPVTETRTT